MSRLGSLSLFLFHFLLMTDVFICLKLLQKNVFVILFRDFYRRMFSFLQSLIWIKYTRVVYKYQELIHSNHESFICCLQKKKIEGKLLLLLRLFFSYSIFQSLVSFKTRSISFICAVIDLRHISFTNSLY